MGKRQHNPPDISTTISWPCHHPSTLITPSRPFSDLDNVSAIIFCSRHLLWPPQPPLIPPSTLPTLRRRPMMPLLCLPTSDDLSLALFHSLYLVAPLFGLYLASVSLFLPSFTSDDPSAAFTDLRRLYYIIIWPHQRLFFSLPLLKWPLLLWMTLLVLFYVNNCCCSGHNTTLLSYVVFSAAIFAASTRYHAIVAA